LGAAVAALTAVLWPVVHYASGFGSIEAVALRSVTPMSRDAAASFLALNIPVHAAHVVTLLVGLVALLAMPLSAGRSDSPPRAR
jgi:hypothetical protein